MNQTKDLTGEYICLFQTISDTIRQLQEMQRKLERSQMAAEELFLERCELTENTPLEQGNIVHDAN